MSHWTLPSYAAEKGPTTDAMRSKLGGRVGSAGSEFIGKQLQAGPTEAPGGGWVLAADETHFFARTGGGEVRRVAKAGAALFESTDEDPRTFQLRAWSAVTEQSEIEVQDRTGSWLAGFLVERCRFGALVAREVGSIVASGFLAVRPARASLH